METTSERILRELQERDKLLDASDLRRQLDSLQQAKELFAASETLNSSKKLASQLESLNVAKELAKRAREYSQALDIAKQLSGGVGAAVSQMSPPLPSKVAGLPVKTVADLAPIFRKARKAMKLNQSEFAAHAGVGRRFVSELEGGKPSLEFDKVMACAAAAGIDLSAKVRKS